MFNKTRERFQNISTKVNDGFISMVESSNENTYGRVVLSTTAVAGAVILNTQRVGAVSTFTTKIKTILNDLYSELYSLSTYAAIVVIIFALISRYFARNPRSIEAANSTIKNAAFTWVAIRMLGLFLNVGRDVIDKEDINWVD